jgi:C4-dicarboxylate-specific signal transduction histidine kinase
MGRLLHLGFVSGNGNKIVSAGESMDMSLMTADTLRRHAEERSQTERVGHCSHRIDDEMRRLVHNLEVHQIDLEMQNDELCLARDMAEKTLESIQRKKMAEALARRMVGNAEVLALQLMEEASAKAVLKAEGLAETSEEALALARRMVKAAEVLALQLVEEATAKALLRTEGLAETSEEALALARRMVEDAEALQAVEEAAEVARLKVVRAAEVARLTVLAFIGKKRVEETNITLVAQIVKDTEKLCQQNEMLILQDRLSVMGEMINNIAHQWNQPLNALGLIVQQLPLYYESETLTFEVLEENTRLAMKLIKNMSQTINTFKNLFKVDKINIPFSVNDVVINTLSFVKKTFSDEGIIVDISIEGNPIATGIPNEYTQVLLNIMMNARDALAENKVDDALISIHAYADCDKSVVTITDNAGGIAEEIIDKLFDAYFTTKSPKGTGIGLFMSKSIIEQSMGGRLSVRNTNNGAEFRIEI